MARIVDRRIFPERVLGSRATTSAVPEGGDGADAVADHRHQLGLQHLGLHLDAGLQHHEARPAPDP